jgi:hypothetical protein
MKYINEIKNIDDDLIEHNQISPDELFEIYRDQNFIYPQKQERLKPVMNIVRDNWAKAMKLNFPLFWVSTVAQNNRNIVATGTSWQYLNKGMIAQHLTSSHPVGSRIIFLGMLKKVIENQHTGFLDSYQIYFRPQNKYPARLFGSLSQRAGKGLSGIIPYNYFEVPFLTRYPTGDMEIIEIDNCNYPDFINFMRTHCGELFIRAQELNTTDITLEELNRRFELNGLKRRRRIFAATATHSNHIYGVIIINQSSLGLNFSFFENSCELILRKDANAEALLNATGKLLHQSSELAGNLPLNYIPVLVDPAHSYIVEKLNGKLTKNYNLFIMLKGGYEIWYDHVAQLTNDVFERFINNSYANAVT